MEELKKRVVACQFKWNVAWTERVIYEQYFTNSSCQHYAILVTMALWYKVRLLVQDENDSCQFFIAFDEFGLQSRIERDDLAVSEHWTLKEVEERIAFIRDSFRKTPYSYARMLFKDTLWNFRDKPWDSCSILEVPKDYASNPDKYLKRGDIIATPIAKVFPKYTPVHTGVFLGNGKKTGHGDKKAASRARIGRRLIGDFVSKGTDQIWILRMPGRTQPNEAIARKAEELAANEFRKGKYHILFRNCQHFVYVCATGAEVVS